MDDKGRLKVNAEMVYAAITDYVWEALYLSGVDHISYRLVIETVALHFGADPTQIEQKYKLCKKTYKTALREAGESKQADETFKAAVASSRGWGR